MGDHMDVDYGERHGVRGVGEKTLDAAPNERGDRVHARFIMFGANRIDVTHDLGIELVRARYDALYDFLEGMATELERSAQADQDAGKTKLARTLLKAAHSARALQRHIGEAFRISEPALLHECSKEIEPGSNID
jgi:hypothetical protein